MQAFHGQGCHRRTSPKCPASRCVQERHKVTGSVLKTLVRSCPGRCVVFQKSGKMSFGLRRRPAIWLSKRAFHDEKEPSCCFDTMQLWTEHLFYTCVFMCDFSGLHAPCKHLCGSPLLGTSPGLPPPVAAKLLPQRNIILADMSPLHHLFPPYLRALARMRPPLLLYPRRLHSLLFAVFTYLFPLIHVSLK